MLFIVSEEYDQERIDIYVSKILQECSRNKIKKFIEQGDILLNGLVVKPSRKVLVDDEVFVDERKLSLEISPIKIEAENIPLAVLYEDEDLLVINKERHMVVHPGPGNISGTLVNALLHYTQGNLSGLSGDSRQGIVHRLDKETTGLILVAKTDSFHRQLQELFKARKVTRQYLALVWGQPKSKRGVIDAPIGRHPKERTKMAVLADGKEALSYFEIIERFPNSAELLIRLVTGRTHQIRVHLQYLGTPIIGDDVYGGKRASLGLTGQALHCGLLAFEDPRNGQERTFTVEPPADYLSVKKELQLMV